MPAAGRQTYLNYFWVLQSTDTAAPQRPERIVVSLVSRRRLVRIKRKAAERVREDKGEDNSYHHVRDAAGKRSALCAGKMPENLLKFTNFLYSVGTLRGVRPKSTRCV